MAVRKAFLHVRVVDEKGAERVPGASDEVWIDNAKRTYSAADGFMLELATKDEVKVGVLYKGFFQISQSFKVEAPAERPKLDPFWSGTDAEPDASGKKRPGYLLECMTLQRIAGAKDDDRSPDVFNLTVHLSPTRELAAAIGADYWEGALSFASDAHQAHLDFDKCAQTYAEHLFLLGRVNSSSPFTMLDCQRGVIEHWMRATGKGWKAFSVAPPRKKPAPNWPTPQSFRDWIENVQKKSPGDAGFVDANDFMNANDIYGYISQVGGASGRPGTVIDFSVFSHAWQGGPILFNTMSGGAGRLATDMDMRSDQDFVAPATGGWPNLKAAMASGAEIHVWGCFATDIFHEMIYWLSEGAKATDRFKQVAQTTNGPQPLDLTRAQVVKILNDEMDVSCYMKNIAKHTTCTAFGGPPGYGADLASYSSIESLPKTLRDKIGSKRMCYLPVTIKASQRVRKVYSGPDFNRKFDDFGYLIYPP